MQSITSLGDNDFAVSADCAASGFSAVRSALVPGFNRAGAAAPITIDGVAVVAGLIRRLYPVTAGRRARVRSGRAAPGAVEAALDCASCRAPVVRPGVAIIASLQTSPVPVSADCAACGSIAGWRSAVVPGFLRAGAAAPIIIDSVAIVALLAFSLYAVATGS